MPRLPPAFLRRAFHEHYLLPYLLRTCRDLPSARNELRWLREHVERPNQPNLTSNGTRIHLKHLCIARGKGRPLQYILGSQPFGDLDIKCQPGVLIPRAETEAYTTHIANTLINQHKHKTLPPNATSHLRILDLCTGTGCIALLLHNLLSPTIPSLSILGIDISPQAITLATHNLRSNIAKGHLSPRASAQVQFSQADIFARHSALAEKWDVVVSNPPYISPRDFDKTTERSVRNFEPRQALVPESVPFGVDFDGESDTAVGDAFYPRLLEIARQVEARCLVMEVADMAQARRVASRAVRLGWWTTCEIWRDWPDGARVGRETLELEGRMVDVKGEGNGRAVVLWR